MIAVGLMGYKGAGKDSVANILRDDFGFTVFKWATPLKEMLRTLGLSERQIEGDLKEVPCELLCGKTPRHAMQTLGTEWRLMIGESLWVNIVLQRVRESGVERVVFSDCRFHHETGIIRCELGATLWRIYRPGTASTGHVSERELDEIRHDRSLVNNGTLLDLRETVQAVAIEQFGGTLVAGRTGTTLSV